MDYISVLAPSLPTGVRVVVEGGGDFFLSADGSTLLLYTGEGGDVIIPEGVETIAASAFRNNTSVTSVAFPAGLTTIEAYAFYNCSGLTGELALPDSVTSIGIYAFAYCTGLTSLSLSEGLVAISGYTFSGCTNLAGELIIPASVTTIDIYAFYSCSGFTSLSLSEGLVTIASTAFSYCSSLTGELILPSTLTSIGTSAFSGCTSLTGELVIPASVTSISNSAFYGCSGFTSLTLSDGLAIIGHSAFSSCSGLTGEVIIPDSVNRVDTSAFAYCSNLTSVVLGSSVDYLYNPFYGCLSLVEVTFTSLVPPANATTVFSYVPELEVVYVPQVSYGTYITTLAPSKPGNVRIVSGEGSEFILDGGILMYYVGEGGDIVLPSEVTLIAASAFRNNTSVTSIVFPEGLSTISADAFYGCTGLTGELVLPSTLTSIGSNAFYGCTGLTGSLTLPPNLATLGTGAFRDCTGLSGTLTLPASLPTVSSQAFYGCGNITAIAFSEGLLSIGSEAFTSCSSLGTLALPDSLDYIERSAFSYCYNLESVIFGSGLQRFNSDSQFYGCSKLTEMVFKPATPPTATANALSSLLSLKTIYVYPDSLASYQAALGSSLPDGASFTVDPLMIPVKDLRASHTFSSTVRLSWTAHFDSSVTGYRLERDGKLLATLEDTSFIDTGLITNTSYAYTVYGLTDEEAQTPGTTINVTPQAPVLTSLKTNNALNKVGVTDSRITITAANTNNHRPLDDEHATSGTLYYLNDDNERIEIGKAILDVTSLSTSTARYYLDWNIAEVDDGTYGVVFVLTDADGINAELTGTVIVDHSAPAQIINVIAHGDIDGILVSWSISSEIDTARYRVYRRADSDEVFSLIATINNRNQLNYFDTAVSAERLYHYYVVGVNSFNQESIPSDEAFAIKGVDDAPPQIVSITPADYSVIGGEVSVAVMAIDNVQIVRTEVSYALGESEDWQPLGSDSRTPTSIPLDTTQFADGVIRIKAQAYDAFENQSAPFIVTYHIDNTGPEQVSGLSFTSTATNITLYWNDVADEDVAYFCVEQKSADDTYTVVQDRLQTLGANILNLEPNVSYTYRVVAYDQQGNRGIPSEDITVTTSADTVAPVIISIAPRPGFYAQSIPFVITAQDDYDLASVTLQTSRDKNTWEDVSTSFFPPVQRTGSLAYTLDVSGMDEGSLYVRGTAIDRIGNASDTGPLAPLTEYFIDRTAPEAPESLGATPADGYVHLSWVQGSEKDLYDYAVYRSTTPGGDFGLLAEHVSTLGYNDTTAEVGITYYYAIAARDQAGNLSDLSAAVEGYALEDSEAPALIGITPVSGSTLGGSAPAIRGFAYDNRLLSRITANYTVNGGAALALPAIEAINAVTYNFSFAIPLNTIEDGDSIEVSLVATDASNLSSEPVVVSYTIDRQAPSIANLEATFAESSVMITWNGGDEPDLAGYQIYRKIGSGSYSFIGSRQAIEGQTSYSLDDFAPPLEAVSVSYRVDALDTAGNSASAFTSDLDLPDRSAPKAILNCETSMEVGVEYLFDATLSTDNGAIISYHIDFGDGSFAQTATAVHAYTAIGDYTATLTVVDNAGNQSQISRLINVRDRTLLGTASILVVDGDGATVPGASVYFDLGEENQVMHITGNNGRTSFTASAGSHTVGAIIANNEWLPVKKDVLIKAGEATEISLTLVKHTMIEGTFDIHRMTFDEIIAAGIDISDPANQLIVEFKVHLFYDEEVIPVSFPYNPTTNTGGKGILIGDTYVWIAPIRGGGPTGEGWGGGPTMPESYALGYIAIPANASILKDFYNVDLTIINNAASEFKMLDNRVTLNVPSGLTIMDTPAASSTATVEIDEIPGQSKKTITWILRGDAVGSYEISADYTGTLAEFNAFISAHFVPDKPIEVYGMTGLNARMDVSDVLIDIGMPSYRSVYYNLSLINNSDHEIYLPNIWTPDDRLMGPDDQLTLIASEFFDTEGTLISEQDTEGINFLETGVSEAFDDSLTALGPGEKITRHYRFDRHYENAVPPDTLWLQHYYTEALTQTHGLEFEVVPRPLSYFMSYVVTVGTPGTGDFNGDGHIAASEALIAARAVVLGTTTSAFSADDAVKARQIDALDMDRDGKLTMADAVLILRKAAGL
jgi:fibronectin type 3 domain-containing protein/PKD repeat protein